LIFNDYAARLIPPFKVNFSLYTLLPLSLQS
jgi:hypothetical protein